MTWWISVTTKRQTHLQHTFWKRICNLKPSPVSTTATDRMCVEQRNVNYIKNCYIFASGNVEHIHQQINPLHCSSQARTHYRENILGNVSFRAIFSSRPPPLCLFCITFSQYRYFLASGQLHFIRLHRFKVEDCVNLPVVGITKLISSLCQIKPAPLEMLYQTRAKQHWKM